MKVQIYLKTSPSEPQNYDISIEEFRRLSSDFQQFLQAGAPDRGVYKCHIWRGEPPIRVAIPLSLIFKDIALIG
jgi:hypothetical protein